MLHAMKSRTTSVVHAEIGNWKVNPSRRLEVMPITRHARHALQQGRDAKCRARATPKARSSARRAEGRPARMSQRRVDYVELESSDDGIGREHQRAELVIGLLFTAADPQYVGKDTAEAGSVILNVGEVRRILRDEKKSECQNRTV